MTGADQMPRIVEKAPGDIQHRLWSLYWLVRMTHEMGVVFDLGVRTGDSTRAMLAAAEDVDGVVHGVNIENSYGAVLEETKQHRVRLDFNRFVFHHTDSIVFGLDWHCPVDMVFVDTDHTYEQTKKEIAVWSKHVRVGGCLAFHDYYLKDPPRDGVQQAVDEFAAANSDWKLEVHGTDPRIDPGLAILWRVR